MKEEKKIKKSSFEFSTLTTTNDKRTCGNGLKERDLRHEAYFLLRLPSQIID